MLVFVMLSFFSYSSLFFFSGFHTGGSSLGPLRDDCSGPINSVFGPVWFSASIETSEWWLSLSDWSSFNLIWFSVFYDEVCQHDNFAHRRNNHWFSSYFH